MRTNCCQTGTTTRALRPINGRFIAILSREKYAIHARTLCDVLNSLFFVDSFNAIAYSVNTHTHTHARPQISVCALSCVLEHFVCSIKQRASCVEKKIIVVIYFVVFDHYIALAAHTTYFIQTAEKERGIEKRNETTNRVLNNKTITNEP